MEGKSSAPPLFDKSRVLDVKPLRTLAPVFPTTPKSLPFECVSPFGPFPSGFSPFYPFSAQGFDKSSSDVNQNQSAHAQSPAPAPLQTVRTLETNGGASEPLGDSDSQKRDDAEKSTKSGSSQKRGRRNSDLAVCLSIVDSSFVSGISLEQKDDGDREVVAGVLMRFDAARRRVSQLEDAKEQGSGNIKRSDLRAGNVLMTKGVRTNMRKRIGVVPGIEVGDIFFFRMEICLVGLHAQSMAGIDYMNLRTDSGEELLAVSIVSSGGYDDDAEDSDQLVYSGQGGNVNGKKDKQAADQKLEKGNLALERSLFHASPVRVIRGLKDAGNPLTKIYMYDGLYQISDSWMEKGKSGCNRFKYRLVRMPGQAPSFSIWQSVQKWKHGSSSRAGLILPDLTSGAEHAAVSLVNDVDEVKGPAYFTYSPSVKYSVAFKLATPASGSCSCRHACNPGDQRCSCTANNGGFPYISNGVLVSRRPMVYECGPACPCTPTCKNRLSQTGLRVRLEVFKTADRGWGLRSCDPIRCGTFICEYAGEATEKTTATQDEEDGDRYDYLFDTGRIFEPFKWNCEQGLIENGPVTDVGEEYDIPSPLIISSKHIGNVARFMNHSCYPNVFWQPVMHEDGNEWFLHVAFFAIRHIPPMTELTYDYGTTLHADGADKNHPSPRKKTCLCGSPGCREFFG